MTMPVSYSEGFLVRIPFHMVWLATDTCNASCLHCSSSSSMRSPDELSTREICRVVDEMSDWGVVDLAVSGGEPLLRGDIFEVLQHIRLCGLSAGVGSNGGKLSPVQARKLGDSGINRFQVSLDGLEDQHDTLRRWPGLFQTAVKTIRQASEAGLRVHVCCTINKLNHLHLERFTKFVATLPVARLNLSRFVPTGRGTSQLDLSKDEWHTVVAQCIALRSAFQGRLDIVSHLAQQILVDSDLAELPGFIGCQAGIGQGCLTANGTILPCVLLPVPVGNIRDGSFREIWLNSPIINNLHDRARFDRKCSQCSVVSRCGGCRAVAYANTGDYLAADSRCWL
ncbi:MAG: radical SAM protein [Holophagaceae bacterium]|nr:radical SAM protein [Holophagaceae bacterium]